MKSKLRGIASKTSFLQIARHEAAHIIMLWLMERPVLGCMVSDKGGVTVQLPDETGAKETQNEHILYALAGMIGEKNFELKEDLFEHIENPKYFDSNTDSYHVAQAIALLNGNSSTWLVCYEMAVDKLLVKFTKPYHELTALLVEKGMLDFKTLHELFNKWDKLFIPEGKVKSDVCARVVLRAFGTRLPRRGVFGWDLRLLPDGWRQPKQPTLMQLLQKVGSYLQNKKADGILDVSHGLEGNSQ